MNLDNPIHRLKRIKPKIHLFRDAAILDLFKEIYEIIGWVVSKEEEYKDKQFLFIPISGMHLGGHTTEHFFLKGAPIGIFNLPDKDSRVNAISSILTYSLFNRKVDLSATKILNALQVDSSEKHIVSFGSIKIPDETTPVIHKNFKPYEKGVLWSEKLINQPLWNEFFEKIKVIVEARHTEETIFKIPDLDDLKELLPFIELADATNPKELFYVAENIVELGKRSGLNFNYYFPSLHFAIEGDNDHSYGFMVVSTNRDINAGVDEHTNSLLEFFERLSLVTFSLVGIIEQHHYGKIERLNAKVQLIDKLPEYLLKLTDEIKSDEDRNLLREINDSYQHNPLKKAAGIILRNTHAELNSAEDIIEYKSRKGKGSDLLIWNSITEKALPELVAELKEQRFCYRFNELQKLVGSKLDGYSHPLRHSYDNYLESTDKEKFWQDYQNTLFPTTVQP